MQQLLGSRLKPEECRFQSVSPEKYGRGGFAGLTYTPSKLAGNVLFQQATHMRRMEEGSSRARQSEVMNGLLKQKLKHAEQQRDGIAQSLGQQLAMYKKMLQEAEASHEQRLIELHNLFGDEIQKIIAAKEEEAKYVQAEQELLENRILELEDMIARLRQEATQRQAQIDQLEQTVEALKDMQGKLEQQLQSAEGQIQEARERQAKKEQENKLRMQQVLEDHKVRMQQVIEEHQRQRQSMAKLHESQLQKAQALRIQQVQARQLEMQQIKSKFHQQMRQARHKWQDEVNRLTEIISNKESTINNMKATMKEQQERAAQLAAKQAAEIASLQTERSQLHQKIQTMQAEQLASELKSANMANAASQTVSQLKQDLSKAQKAWQQQRDQLKAQLQRYANEIQRQQIQNDKLRTQAINLRRSAQQGKLLVEQNAVLCRQVRGLKDLLMQSALQMERCKDEFLRLAHDKDMLLVKLRELDLENETLHRIKLQREEQARGWRETYYNTRR